MYIEIRNSKPVEKRGRKAKGLKLRASRGHDSPVAEDECIQ